MIEVAALSFQAFQAYLPEEVTIDQALYSE